MKKHVFFTQTPLGAAIPAVKHVLSMMMNDGIDIDTINSVTISQNDIDTVKVYRGHDISINVARYSWQKDFLLDVIVKDEDIANSNPDNDSAETAVVETDTILVIDEDDNTPPWRIDEPTNNDEHTEDEILYFETFGEWPENDDKDNNDIAGSTENVTDEIIIIDEDTNPVPTQIPVETEIPAPVAIPAQTPIKETMEGTNKNVNKVLNFDMSSFVPISMSDLVPTTENIIKNEKIRRATDVRGNVENIDRDTLIDMIFEWELNHSTNKFYNCVTENDIKNIATKYVTGKYNFVTKDGKQYNVPSDSDMSKIIIVINFIKDNIVSSYKPGLYLVDSYDMLKLYDSVTYFCFGESVKGNPENYVYNITINGITRIKKDRDGNAYQEHTCDADGVKDFCRRIDSYRSKRNYRFLLDCKTSVLKA